MKQIIIALSGRKGSGKNTLATFIQEWYGNDKCFECSFADNLKQFCIETLGLSEKQCYGTDEEKNTPTEYLWESAPEFFRWKFSDRTLRWGDSTKQFKEIDDVQGFYEHLYSPVYGLLPDKIRSGPMSGREVMQIFGTECVREVFGNVWASATIRSVKKRGKPFSIITDNRFPSEIEAVLSEPNGYVIRLTRSPFGVEDLHPSEASLDGFDWQRNKCYTVDNSEMTINKQNEAVVPILEQILGQGSV